MTFDYERLALAAVFASQVIVLSFYVPIRWRQYHASLLAQYPREEYPRLHPIPRYELERKLARFRPLHLIIGGVATLAFLAALFYAKDSRGLAGPMTMCLLVQVLLPLYIALPLEVRIGQASNSMPPPSRRSAELRKWRVTDFVSPLLIALGVAAQGLSLACAVAVHLYRPGTMGIFPTGIGSGLMLLFMGFAVFGNGVTATRSDPFMSPADTFVARQRNYRRLFVFGVLFGALAPLTLLFNAGLIDFGFTYQALGFSVAVQVVGLALVSAWNRDINTRDFSVYRADSSVPVAR
jgi:hypothetical protein